MTIEKITIVPFGLTVVLWVIKWLAIIGFVAALSFWLIPFKH